MRPAKGAFPAMSWGQRRREGRQACELTLTRDPLDTDILCSREVNRISQFLLGRGLRKADLHCGLNHRGHCVPLGSLCFCTIICFCLQASVVSGRPLSPQDSGSTTKQESRDYCDDYQAAVYHTAPSNVQQQVEQTAAGQMPSFTLMWLFLPLQKLDYLVWVQKACSKISGILIPVTIQIFLSCFLFKRNYPREAETCL